MKIQAFLDGWRMRHPACSLKAACGICQVDDDLTEAIDNANTVRKDSIIGKITDIDEYMRSEERLLRMSETDGLTGFLNKAAACCSSLMRTVLNISMACMATSQVIWRSALSVTACGGPSVRVTSWEELAVMS